MCDREDIYFANTAVQDGSDRSQLLQMFLRKDAFEDERYPELSRAVSFFKKTEGGYLRVCKTVEDYARKFAQDYAKDYGQQCRIEGHEEGRKEGRAEGIEVALHLLKQRGYDIGDVTPEELAVEDSLANSTNY